MKRAESSESGVVLINALIIVLAISTIAAALLTRSETARVRAADSQGAHQLALYLDGIEALVPRVLKEVSRDSVAHLEQVWAADILRYPIDRGVVTAKVVDLQGRLNVNWLVREDEYVQQVFAQVFAELNVPQSLVLSIADFVTPNGPRNVSDYLSRQPAILPRGGPLKSIDELREIKGMTPEHFATLKPYLSALQSELRLNLNTAPEVLRKAAMHPFPSDVITEFLNADEPLQSLSKIRKRTTEILETEELDDLPFDRLTYSSNWFRADLTAELDGLQQHRQAVILLDPAGEDPLRVVARWAVYD